MIKRVKFLLFFKPSIQLTHEEIRNILDQQHLTIYFRKHYKYSLPIFFVSYILVCTMLELEPSICTTLFSSEEDIWLRTISLLAISAYGTMAWFHVVQLSFYRCSKTSTRVSPTPVRTPLNPLLTRLLTNEFDTIMMIKNEICENFSIVHSVGFTIYMTTCFSMIYAYVNHSGYCKDSSNVFWNKSDIADWFIHIPLIMYTIVSVDEKDALTIKDHQLLVLTFMIVVSRILLFIDNVVLTIILGMTMACSGLFFSYILINHVIVYKKYWQTHLNEPNILLVLYRKQAVIMVVILFLLMFAPFTIILYALRLSDLIHPVISFIVLSFFAKSFVLLRIYNNMTMMLTTQNQEMIQKGQNACNDIKMYVIHTFSDINRLCNILYLGINLLKSNVKYSKDDRVKCTILMIEEASNTLKEKTMNILKDDYRTHDHEQNVFNIKRVVMNVVQVLVRDLMSKAIRVHLKYEETAVLNVFGDKDNIEKVIKLILKNAIKHSPIKSTIVVTITSYPLTYEKTKYDDVREIVVSILDEGIGMSKYVINAILENNDNVSAVLLLGEELMEVKHILKQMGGHMNVESKVGAGTKFTISVPFPVIDMILEDQSVSNNVDKSVRSNESSELSSLSLLPTQQQLLTFTNTLPQLLAIRRHRRESSDKGAPCLSRASALSPMRKPRPRSAECLRPLEPTSCRQQAEIPYNTRSMCHDPETAMKKHVVVEKVPNEKKPISEKGWLQKAMRALRSYVVRDNVEESTLPSYPVLCSVKVNVKKGPALFDVFPLRANKLFPSPEDCAKTKK